MTSGRNDAFLYSGITSASAAKQQEKKAQRTREKTDKRSQLKPVQDIYSAEIEKEIALIQNIDFLNIESMLDDQHFKAELMARKKTIERLRAVQSRINNILREPKDER